MRGGVVIRWFRLPYEWEDVGSWGGPFGKREQKTPRFPVDAWRARFYSELTDRKLRVCHLNGKREPRSFVGARYLFIGILLANSLDLE